MTTLSEKEIEKTVVDWAKRNGWLAIKYTPMGVRGWPDRIFISPKGVHVWIEFKRPKNKPTDMQRFRMKQLEENHCHVAWFDDGAACINKLKELGGVE